MPNKHGDFIWYELLTPDADAAQDFYGSVLNWSFETREDMDYRMIAGSGGGVGGFMPLTEEMSANGARPAWLGYICVDDVDASAKSIETAGGSIHAAPWDIPGVGRMALVTDPQGAIFYIMKPTPPADTPDAASAAFAATEPMDGHCAWNELLTSDPEAAKSFYFGQFGWEKDGDMDVGPMGKYEFLRHDFMLGALMKMNDDMPMPLWSYYFRVPEIDAAVETVKAKGGRVIVGPQEIPGGEFIVNGIDPQGAIFALVGAKNRK